MLVSEMAGRASIELKGKELGYDLVDKEVIGRIVERVKDLESRGWTFDAADASFELLMLDEIAGRKQRFFTVDSWKVVVEQDAEGEVYSEATVAIVADEQRLVSTGEGNGPVNALDNALRTALTSIYPELSKLELVDYKVRILEGVKGTGAVTRVLIETSDGDTEWDTVGVHENVVAASWKAISDAVAYGLLRAGRKPN